MGPAAAPKTYSILLAHPRKLLLEALAALCRQRPEYRIVHQCSDGITAMRTIAFDKPDVAVLDISLSGAHVLETINKMRKAEFPTRFVMLLSGNDSRTVIHALRSQVSALVLQSDPAEYLFEAFKSILADTVYVSPSLEIDKLLNAERRSKKHHSSGALSEREHQVFSLLVEGIRAKEIGARLGLNPKTIDTYRVNLMRKLNIHSVAGLVKFDIERKLANGQ